MYLSLFSRGSAVVGALVACFCSTMGYAQVTFTLLGPSAAWASGVTNDGSLVVGGLQAEPWERETPFRWTAATGAEVFAGVPTVSHPGELRISGSGTVAAGTTSDFKAFRWDQSGGTGALSLLPGRTSSFAHGLSNDGSTVVGMAKPVSPSPSFHSDAFRWTKSGGVTSLGTLGGASNSAHAVSADGSVVTGSSGLNVSDLHEVPFRWTEEGGMQALSTPGGRFGTGTGINSDGTVIVGFLGPDSLGYRAFRWTEADGVVPLRHGGASDEFRSEIPTGVSDDGSFIIGGSGGGPPFVWTPESGMRDLLEVLTHEYGLSSELDNWHLTDANAMSPDGRYIVGTAFDGTSTQGWLLDRGTNPPPILPVPEPETYGIVAAALLGAVILRHRLAGLLRTSPV